MNNSGRFCSLRKCWPALVILMVLICSAAALAVESVPGPPIVIDNVSPYAPSQSATMVQTNQSVTLKAYAYDIDTVGDPHDDYDRPLNFIWWGSDLNQTTTTSTQVVITRNGSTLKLERGMLSLSWSTPGIKTIHLKVDDHPYFADDPDTSQQSPPVIIDFTVIVDNTAPTTPTVTDDGDFTSLTSELHATWSAADPETGIYGYEYAIGTSPTDPGSGYVSGWSFVSTPGITKTGLSLTEGTTYYFYVTAVNNVNMEGNVGVSNGITVALPHDAESDFSLNSNPNGRWTYGKTADLGTGYTLTPYDTPSTDTSGIQRWHMQAGNEPSVTHNATANSITNAGTTWLAHTMALSPGTGANGAISIVRWTAPASGTYDVYAKFSDITGGYTSTDVHILKNGVALLDGALKNSHEGPTPRVDQPVQTFSTSVTVNKNDRIDFAVGCGNDNNGDLDTTGLEARVSPSVVTNDGTPTVDNGLPTDTNSLNNSAGANRCNFRWANSEYNAAQSTYTKGYGDTFSLASGGTWVIDTIRVWAVPQIPVAPAYCLGSHFASVSLYTGTVTGALTLRSTGNFLPNSNETSNQNIFIKPVQYAGGLNYQRAAGDYNQIWEVDFNNLDWTVTGSTTYTFGVLGVPRIDRLWFNHATRIGSPDDFCMFDTTALSGSRPGANGAAWFDGQYSDINIQVFAHRK